MSPLSPEQGNKVFLHRSLRQKKRAREGKTSAFVTSPPLQATLSHALLRSSHYAIAPFGAHSVVPARFSRQAFAQSSPAATLAPKPSMVSLRSISLYWVQPPLIVRLACCSRGCRAVTVFALLRFVSFAPALNYRCGSIRFLRDLNPLNSHILSTQKRACLSLITLRSAHSSTFH